MEKDIAFARRQVEGFEFVAWKFFKPLVYQRSAFSGNNRFVPVTLYCSIMRSVLEYLCQLLHSSLPHYLSDERERFRGALCFPDLKFSQRTGNVTYEQPLSKAEQIII